MNTTPSPLNTLDRLACALDLCRALDVVPTFVTAGSLTARLLFDHEGLTRNQRQALKRHFGKFRKCSFSGDILTENSDDDDISATISGAYECRTVCVATKSGADDFTLPAETVG